MSNKAAQSAFLKALEREKEEKPTQAPQQRPSGDTVTPRLHETMKPSKHASNREPAIAISEEIVAAVRQELRQPGHRQATYRMTAKEKKGLKDLRLKYFDDERGLITSDNEMVRAAVNFVLKDFEENKGKSFLARVLEALNQ